MARISPSQVPQIQFPLISSVILIVIGIVSSFTIAQNDTCLTPESAKEDNDGNNVGHETNYLLLATSLLAGAHLITATFFVNMVMDMKSYWDCLPVGMVTIIPMACLIVTLALMIGKPPVLRDGTEKCKKPTKDQYKRDNGTLLFGLLLIALAVWILGWTKKHKSMGGFSNSLF